MYLIAKFEKKLKDLVQIPETEKEIYDMFNIDVNNFLELKKDEYHYGQIMRIPFITKDIVGVEIYKI